MPNDEQKLADLQKIKHKLQQCFKEVTKYGGNERAASAAQIGNTVIQAIQLEITLEDRIKKDRTLRMSN